ncbi:hypothetical protein K402DRAFT_383751 [Aulographum hederae CBS 113979]|uniref:Cell wall mannoprotein PIR1-like C-terminal domain-containing protein n=1 Tax=Aulographum hederae CBS 113979 TaxID=1176131 RepID=A0A6G1GQ56_9PEZI|nr:hypothetical protein K402DRAFT_383751 [Aulographum hederae CBS 113979]
MRTILALAIAASVYGLPQGVTEEIPPPGGAPSGCKPSASGTFQIGPLAVDMRSKRDLSEVPSDVLTVTLENGVLTDALKRTGYIADNFQFQFDGPPQAGAIYTSGFSLCSDNSLALGPTTVFYQCLSGDFSNLYFQTDKGSLPEQCSPVHLQAINFSGGDSQGGGAVPASQLPDGQPNFPTGATIMPSPSTPPLPPLSESGDGQPIASTMIPSVAPPMPSAPVPSPAPSAPAPSMAPPAPPASSGVVPITQISDGQVRLPQRPSASFKKLRKLIH